MTVPQSPSDPCAEADQAAWRPPALDLAHELRTPLHAIRNAADLVLSGDAGAVSGEAAALVAEIAAAARRLEPMVEAAIASGLGPAATADAPAAGDPAKGT